MTMTNAELKQQHIDRIRKAVRYEPSDRTALAVQGGVLLGKYADPSFTPGDIMVRPEWAMDRMIEGAIKIDADEIRPFEYPYATIMGGGARIKVPGKDLPMESYWQIDEVNFMKAEHYDYIIEHGYADYEKKFIDPCYDPDYPEEVEKFFRLAGVFEEKLEQTSLPPPMMHTCMLEMGFTAGPICMGRGFANFLMDMRRFPEKVVKVSRMIRDYSLPFFLEQMKGNPMMVTVFMGRTDQDALKFETFEKYFWPFFEETEELITSINKDVFYHFHIDGNYTKHVELFKRLRPKHTVLFFDGLSDAEKMADELTKHEICFCGDLHPALLTLGTPDDVYQYCMKLKRLYGPGLILNAGCCFPPDTKIENLEAMRSAANDSVR
jgi:uroporphyrinogen decarboxylase